MLTAFHDYTVIFGMSSAEPVPKAELATPADADQPAEAAVQAAEPAGESDADVQDAAQPHADAAAERTDKKSSRSAAKSPPANSGSSQPAERPTGRRERKQTSFFQPEKKLETEKLEIKEVRLSLRSCCSFRLLFWILCKRAAYG